VKGQVVRKLVTSVLLVVALGGASLFAASLSTAPQAGAAAAPRLVGTWPDTYSGSGGWMLWSNGSVHALENAPFFGDASKKGLNSFVGMVPDAAGDGYWLLTSTGRVYPFGHTCADEVLKGPAHVPTSGIVGGIDRSDGIEGFDMVTSRGGVYGFKCTYIIP
jgi:hypothetical protein